jgi:hypothetical protein
MHNPVLRLVSLNPAFSVSFSFLRLWEIPDGFEYKLFISRDTTVGEAVDAVVRELGLAKTLPVAGGGNLEYVLEEVWTDSKGSGACLPLYIFFDLRVSRILPASAFLPHIQHRQTPFQRESFILLGETLVQILHPRRVVSSVQIACPFYCIHRALRGDNPKSSFATRRGGRRRRRWDCQAERHGLPSIKCW